MRLGQSPQRSGEVERPGRGGAQAIHRIEQRREQRGPDAHDERRRSATGRERPRAGGLAFTGREDLELRVTHVRRADAIQQREPRKARQIVSQRKFVHPIEWTRKPVIGPAITRGRLKMLDSTAYWVAEKRFSREPQQEHRERPRAHTGREALEDDRPVHEGRLTPVRETST